MSLYIPGVARRHGANWGEPVVAPIIVIKEQYDQKSKYQDNKNQSQTQASERMAPFIMWKGKLNLLKPLAISVLHGFLEFAPVLSRKRFRQEANSASTRDLGCICEIITTRGLIIGNQGSPNDFERSLGQST
uniref:Uncharacterized protein n=1 Tax=Coccidioides posadasii RMSCC 3488 TaxID=454284 RepID=A0A0J6FEE7_COCPO|nr:hypothetical protein CPAG_05017 [Coccidioides posadasii RMSCC 3488]